MVLKMINPFCIGYHLEPKSDDPERRVRQDGFVSTLILLIFLLSLSVSLSIGHWVAVDTPGEVPLMGASDICLVLLMTIAIAIMLVLRCSDNTTITDLYRDVPVIDDVIQSGNDVERDAQQVMLGWLRQVLRMALPLIGIVLFFIIGSFNSLLIIASMASCLDTYYRCSTETVLRYVGNIFYHSFRFVFMGLVMLFCMFFHKRKFVKCASARYFLIVVLSTVLSLWFETMMYEARKLFRGQQQPINCSFPLDEEEDILCLHENNTIYNLHASTIPFLVPINIEYFLLVSEVIIHLYFGMTRLPSPRRESNHDLKSVTEWLAQGIPQSLQQYGAQEESSSGISSPSSTERILKECVSGHPSSQSLATFPPSTSSDEGGVESLIDSCERTPLLSGSNGRAVRKRHKRYDALSPAGVSTTPRSISPGIDLTGSHLDLGRHFSLIQNLHRLDQYLVSQGESRELSADLQAKVESARGHLRTFSTQLYLCSLNGTRAGDPVQGAGMAETNSAHASQVSEEHDRHTSLSNREDTYTTTAGTSAVTNREDDNPRPPQQAPPPKMSPCILFSILFNLLFITLGFVTYVPGDQSTWIAVYIALKIIHRTPWLIACVVGFRLTKEFQSKFHDFKGIELMIILTTVGNSFFYVFTSVAAVAALFGENKTASALLYLGADHEDHHEAPVTIPMVWAHLISQNGNLIVSLLQTAFMIHAARVSGRAMQGTPQYVLFRLIVLYLAMCNLATWINDSFIEFAETTHLSGLQEEYYGADAWDVIYHITMPFTLFYRFNSFILFMEIFLDA